MRIDACGNLEKMTNDVKTFVKAMIFFPDIESTGIEPAYKGSQEFQAVEVFFYIKIKLGSIAGLEQESFADRGVGVHFTQDGFSPVG